MTVRLRVEIARQRLYVEGDGSTAQYRVSTARNGAGELMDSECTPRGRHRIRACIGAGLPPGSVFVGRRPTGEIYDQSLARRYPDRDWILSRILWLCGCEPGRNRLGRVDSMRRFIYLHGTPDEAELGQPVSHGCIRMANADIVTLFDQLSPGTEVQINE